MKTAFLRTLDRIPRFFKSFYFLGTVAFAAWMLLLDNNDLITQYQLRTKLRDLEQQREYFRTRIEEVRAERQQLDASPQALEKFAREKYLMKRPEEDVYVIVREEEE